MGERKELTLSEVFDAAWGYFVLCQVTGRDAAGRAEKFVILSKHASGVSAKRELGYYLAESFDALVIPAFENEGEGVRMVFGAGGEIGVVEELFEPEEVARFFRSYYLPPEMR